MALLSNSGFPSHSKKEWKVPPMAFRTLSGLVLRTSLTSSPRLPHCFLCSIHTGLPTVPHKYQECPQLPGFAFVCSSLFLWCTFPNYLHTQLPYLSLISYVLVSGKTSLPTQSKIANPLHTSSHFLYFSPEHLSCSFLISLIKDKLHKSRILGGLFCSLL